MATFKSLGIKRIEKRFSGNKITSLDKIIGKPIKILDFEVCPSVKKAGTTYVKLQILFEGEKKFFMTGGKYLQLVLKQIDPEALKEEPIETKILRENGCYYFEGTMVNNDEKYDENEEVEIIQ